MKSEVHSLAWMAFDFWKLTENAAEELIKSDNQNSMLYEGWGWPSEDEWDNHTKWSDINIGLPVLFNFYHGIELSLKALILAKGENAKSNHKLTELAETVALLYVDEQLNAFYCKYISTDKLHVILKGFCTKSGMSMDLYFQSLKYPTSTRGVKFNHSSLRYNGQMGVEFFEQIICDIRFVRAHIIKLINQMNIETHA